MIYLIAEIFIYLLLALALGVAAGWLWRNLQATARESEMQRMLNSRPQVPQMETTVRTWEQRLERALGELNFREMELAEQQEKLSERDRAVADLERACARLREQLAARAAPEPAAPAERPDDQATPHPGDAGEAAAEAQRALEEDLAQSREELDRVQRALAAEKRRVEELTQERELQRRSLQALEQQLELAREGESRRASG